MALAFERRHLTFLTWFHKRPVGKIEATSTTNFCALLTTDTGAADKEAILTADPGTLTDCAELTTTTV